ncbi:MAG: twin-arginine translocation signal domain-containing protein [Gammaproteobacteria bacterium]|nr:twin-arginine translocation signal domain-containing protein [Gammaproteobacteria bacterium]
MKDTKQPETPSRRKFLRTAIAGSGAAAATAVVPGVALADAAEPQADAKPNDGYRLSQHILDYYKSAAS